MPSNSRTGYGIGSPLPPLSPVPVISTRVPLASDLNFELGTTWIDTTTNQAWTMTGSAAGAATWSLSSPGASDVDTLTGDAGGAISPVAGNINILGGVTTDVAGAPGSLTVNPSANGYPASPYIVGAAGEGGYATITAAITAATGSGTDQTIIVQPGTYTENLTLVDGITIVGTIAETTTITGVHTPPAAGTISFKTLTLTSATDIFNSAAAGTTAITVNDCDINVTNGYLFNLLNWTGDIFIFDSGAYGTNDGFINNTGGSDVRAENCSLGAGVGNAYGMSGGAVTFRRIDLTPPGTFGGAATVDVANSIFFGTLTTAGTATFLIGSCIFHTGATACINHGSAGTIVVDNDILNTANNPAIAGAGAGVLTIGSTSFENDTNLAGTLTLAYAQTTTGVLNATGAHLINSGAGNDITLTMGDNAGANGVIFNDLAGNPVLTVDSNGGIAPAGAFAVTGAFTQTAGIANIGADAAANAVNIGTGAAAKVVTMGSVNGASSLDLLAGTGNFSLEGNVATTYAISNVGVNTGQVDIAGGTGVRAINIGAGGTGAKTIGIGAAASADVITIGDATGAGSLALVCGTGNFSLEGNVATTYALSNTGVNTGQVDLAGGTGVRTINIGGGGTGAKTINIGGAASADVITIGDATGAGSLDLVCGTGNLTLTSTGAGDILIDSDDTLLLDADGVLELNSSAGIIGIGSDADAFDINVGTGGAARVITVGNVTGATQVVLNSGTAGVNINTTGAGDVTIDSDDTFILDADGVIDINSSAGIINIGDDADAFDINVGTGAAARILTLGNVTGASQVVVDCGTAGVNVGVSATVHETTIGSLTGASGVTINGGTGNIDLNGTCENVLSKFVTRTGDDITLEASPIVQSSANTGAAPTGATGDVNILTLQEGIIMESFVLGAGQTIIAPRMDANGLIISGDLTDAEGYEYNFGGALDISRHTFTIGTDAAFFMLCTFRVADISGIENMLMGFKRSGAANNANFALYADFAAIGPSDAISPGDAAIQTQLNTGGVVPTDTNDAWGDNTNHELGVYVDAAGNVTFTFDGAPPTATQVYQFDNGDIVCPFTRHIFNAAAPGLIHLQNLQVGYQ